MMYYVIVIEREKGGDTVIKRKYVLLLLLALVSIPLTGLLCSNLAQAQSTVTGYVSVSPAAFVSVDSSDYTLTSNYLANYENALVTFVGAVQLPHGATLTNVTFFWRDKDTSLIWFDLIRYNETDWRVIANIGSTGNASVEWGYSYNDNITDATIDNSQYAYYMRVAIPSSVSHLDYQFRYAIIEYTLPSQAVGGFWIPIDKLGLLAPYLALVSTIILAVSISVAYIKYRKKQ
jgi:hypothetical protein